MLSENLGAIQSQENTGLSSTCNSCEKTGKSGTSTHKSLNMNSRNSENERTKVWTGRHQSPANTQMNARTHKVWWVYEGLNKKPRVWWTHESLNFKARILVNARKFGHDRTKVWWTHESLAIRSFRLGCSGHDCFSLAPQPGQALCFLITLFSVHCKNLLILR